MTAQLFGKKEMPKIAKREMVRKMVKPMVIFGYDTWIMTERHRNRLNALLEKQINQESS